MVPRTLSQAVPGAAASLSRQAALLQLGPGLDRGPDAAAELGFPSPDDRLSIPVFAEVQGQLHRLQTDLTLIRHHGKIINVIHQAGWDPA